MLARVFENTNFKRINVADKKVYTFHKYQSIQMTQMPKYTNEINTKIYNVQIKKYTMSKYQSIQFPNKKSIQMSK